MYVILYILYIHGARMLDAIFGLNTLWGRVTDGDGRTDRFYCSMYSRQFRFQQSATPETAAAIAAGNHHRGGKRVEPRL